MIKTIIFDLGGVCFDIDWVKINEEMVRKYNIATLIKSSPGNERIIEYYKDALEGKRPPKDLFKELNKNNFDIDEVVLFYKEMYKKYKNHNDKIYSLIKRLKKSFQVVCLSDTNQLHLEAHQEQGSVKEFHKVFTSFNIGSIKRNPETFKEIIGNLSVNPAEVIFIDDNEKNVESAKSVGINGIRYINYEDLVIKLKECSVA